MAKFHHRPPPSFSTLLAGPRSRDESGFLSDRFQINYFNPPGHLRVAQSGLN
ncbi:hypothetical protein [Ktedonobacter sp. SOSP1-85]|uniref:hypothetical protein n=1 Tax=Ktedonobacter sp. SOSP1-85 TaxID=2778367 RepID=UPI001916496E|nr:hypothetical protein [Ktedonobacter sp. SOSP1-85]